MASAGAPRGESLDLLHLEDVSFVRITHDCEPAPSEALVVNGNVQRFRIAGNYVHDVNNIGIDVIGGERWLSRVKRPPRRANAARLCRRAYRAICRRLQRAQQHLSRRAGH